MTAGPQRIGFAYWGTPADAKTDDLLVWFDGSVIGVLSDPVTYEPGVIKVVGLVDDDETPSMLLGPAKSRLLIIREAAGISEQFDGDELECVVRTCAELWAWYGDPDDELSQRQRAVAQRASAALEAEYDGVPGGGG